MTVTFDATYVNGVLVPARLLALAERERVRVTLESIQPLSPPGPEAEALVRQQAANRLQADPDLVLAIASTHEFDQGADE